MQNENTKGWYKSPCGKVEYLSHMEVIWSEMASGQVWQRVSAPNTACSRRVPRRGAKKYHPKNKVMVGRTRG
jgi:hypothetical protein